MTGPAAILPQAPSLPAAPTAKSTHSSATGKIDMGGLGGFSELLANLAGTAQAPDAPDQDAEAQRDDSAGPMPVPVSILIPMTIFTERPPQSPFADDPEAAMPTGFARASIAVAAAPPALVAEPPVEAEVAKTLSQAALVTAAQPRPLQPRPQPPISNAPAGPVATADPAGTPEPLAAIPSAPPFSAPAPASGEKQRHAVKAPKQDAPVIGTLGTTATEGLQPPAAETQPQKDRSGQDGKPADTELTLSVPKEMKVSAVRQETHFVPVPQQSLIYQIANRIVQDAETADPAFTAQPAALPKDTIAAPVKVLELKLDPPELGALTIRMTLRDAVLHLEIEASRHETARMIESDRDALTGMLRSAGYGVDGLNVQIATGDRGNGGQQFNAGSGFNQSAGQHPAGRQPDNNSSGQRWQDAGTPDQIAENRRDSDQRGPNLRPGDPVYL